ncbi:MAG: deoxyribonuclease V [Candidatus Acidiferrales bacterium]
MKVQIRVRHTWNLTPGEARDLQLKLRSRVELKDRLPRIRTVAGADVALELPERRSWETGTGRAIAGVVLYRYPEMEEIERVHAIRPLRFPYVPGLLSFRELPALLAAFCRLKSAPDLIFADGQGYAHPRRMGLASHLGVLLDLPTIGVAKSRLVGHHNEPPVRAGRWTPLLDQSPEGGEERIGAVLRVAHGVRPIYISQGHRISLETAIKFVLAVSDGYRIPRPTRDADRYVADVKRGRRGY